MGIENHVLKLGSSLLLGGYILGAKKCKPRNIEDRY